MKAKGLPYWDSTAPTLVLLAFVSRVNGFRKIRKSQGGYFAHSFFKSSESLFCLLILYESLLLQ